MGRGNAEPTIGELASLEELANKGKLTRIMDIMNIDPFSLLGFGDFWLFICSPIL